MSPSTSTDVEHPEEPTAWERAIAALRSGPDRSPSDRTSLEAAARTIAKVPSRFPLPVDADGSIWLRWGSTPFRLWCKRTDPVLLSAQAVLIEGVTASTELLHELNELNAGIVSCRVFFDRGWCVAEEEVVLAEARHEALEHLAWAVGSLADYAADELEDQFGGTRYVNVDARLIPGSD